MRFDGKVVVVTGAASDIGREFARQFARRGASVAVCDAVDCQRALDAVRGEGAAGIAVRVNAGDSREATKMAAAVVAEFGGIDILVNNASLFDSLTFAGFDRLDEDEWDRVMAVNVKGLWQTCRAVVPAMRKRGGAIVNMSSMAAIEGLPDALHYTASQAAIIGMTRGLARELGRFDIRVNAVAPQPGGPPARQREQPERRQGSGRSERPGDHDESGQWATDTVGAVLYLAGDESRLTTGQTITMDGNAVFL